MGQPRRRFAEVIVGVDPDPKNKEKITQWARDYWAATHPYNMPGAYVNFMMADEGAERVQATYRDNYKKLVSVKRKVRQAQPVQGESEHQAVMLTTALFLFAIASTVAQSPQPAPVTVKPSATSRAPEPPGPPVPRGPYAEVTIDAAEGLPTHTVYRPTDLSSFPAEDKLPIVVWGNGACRMDGLMFERFLTKIASHGFLVVAVGPKGAREQATKSGTPVGGGATGAHLIQAIDWGVKENDRAGSPLRGKIDTGSVAMMGQSCGGLMAIESAFDPRVDTLVILNSGVFNTPPPGMGRLTSATKDSLAKIHSNTAYINGGVSDIAFENSNDDVSRINQVPLFYGVMKDGGSRGHVRARQRRQVCRGRRELVVVAAEGGSHRRRDVRRGQAAGCVRIQVGRCRKKACRRRESRSDGSGRRGR